MHPLHLVSLVVCAPAVVAAAAGSKPKSTVTTPGLMTSWPDDRWPTTTIVPWYFPDHTGPTTLPSNTHSVWHHHEYPFANLQIHGRCSKADRTCNAIKDSRKYQVPCGAIDECSGMYWEKLSCKNEGDYCHIFGFDNLTRKLPDSGVYGPSEAHCDLKCPIGQKMAEYWEGFRPYPVLPPRDPDYSPADVAKLEPNGKCNAKKQICNAQYKGKTHHVQCGPFKACSYHLFEKQACRKDGDPCHVFGLGSNHTLPPNDHAHCHLKCNISVGMAEYYEGNRSKPIFGPLTRPWSITGTTARVEPTEKSVW